MTPEDARCPECRCPATRTLGFGGWLFRCDHCNRAWGHPQEAGASMASEALYDLRRKQWAICRYEATWEERAHAAIASQPLVPAGWKIVPVEPTLKMTHAAFMDSRYGGKTYGVEPELRTALPIAYESAAAEQVYRAMLAASPAVQEAPAYHLSRAEQETMRKALFASVKFVDGQEAPAAEHAAAPRCTRCGRYEDGSRPCPNGDKACPVEAPAFAPTPAVQRLVRKLARAAISAPEQAAPATGGTDRETLLTALRDRLPLNTDQRSMLYVLVQQAHPDRKPDGWAYRYPGPYGGLRFNQGQEVNGSKPAEAVPYFLGEPPAQQADARDAARWRYAKSIAHQKTAYDVYGNGAHWTIGIHSRDSRESLDTAIDAAMSQEPRDEA